jgi:hypothetical protein
MPGRRGHIRSIERCDGVQHCCVLRVLMPHQPCEQDRLLVATKVRQVCSQQVVEHSVQQLHERCRAQGGSSVHQLGHTGGGSSTTTPGRSLYRTHV